MTDLKEMIKVGFKLLTDDAILPVKAHATDSGFDLFANENVSIAPGETVVVKTGVAVHLPNCYEAQVRPRSGITSNTKLRVQIGTIDNQYTGNIGIIVDNTTSKIFQSMPRLMKGLFIGDDDYNVTKELWQEPIKIKKGDKIAQLVVAPIPKIESYEIEELPQTERGTNGFGSSGY